MELPNRKTCLDFLYFRQLLREDRRFDDNITHEMNDAKLTDHRTCLAFWQRMQEIHRAREEAIRTCLVLYDTTDAKKEVKCQINCVEKSN